MALQLSKNRKTIKPTTDWMEIVLSNFFDIRRNFIVPRVSWGLNGEYEKDLVVVYPSGWATEIEIKISKADLKSDLKKPHSHDSILMRKLYFAIPETMNKEDVISLIPEKAGIIVINNSYIPNKKNSIDNLMGGWNAHIVRECIINKKSRKLTEVEIKKIQRLGYLRYWSQARKIFIKKQKVD